MAPKAKSQVEHVDGVHCILNLASKVVVVGTGLVANAERDTFKLKASGTLADQVRARPKFALFAAAMAGAAAAIDDSSTAAEPQPPPPSSAAPSSSAEHEVEIEPAPQRRRLLNRDELMAFENAALGSSSTPQQAPLPLMRDLQSLSQLNRTADGPALRPGWGFAEERARRENDKAEAAAFRERHNSDVAARRERAARWGDATFALIQEPWEQLRKRHWWLYKSLPEVASAGLIAAEAKLAEVSDLPAEEQTASAKVAGEEAMVAAWKAIDPPTARRLDYLQTCQVCFRQGPLASVFKCSDTCVPMCNSGCKRRGPCPNHFGNRASWAGVPCSGEPSVMWRLQAYAEVAAGKGCCCTCCLHHFETEAAGFVFDDEIHDDVDEARALVREALKRAGNPPCRMRDILLRSEACTGSCGVELQRGFCGEADVSAVLTHLMKTVVMDAGEAWTKRSEDTEVSIACVIA